MRRWLYKPMQEAKPELTTGRMSVIFLDINGVINPVSALRLATFGKVVVALSPIAVGLLNRLCYETNAQLVISSSWRLFGQQVVMRQIFKSHAFLNGLLDTTDKTIPFCMKCFRQAPDPEDSWRTPFLENKPDMKRGHEIDSWLNKWGHLIENYCILDDHPWPMLEQQRSNLVYVERNHSGFDVEYYEQALEILQNSKSKS